MSIKMMETVARVVTRTGAYTAQQSVAGVETVARNGAWVIMEGAQVCLPFQPVQRNAVEAELCYEHTRRVEEGREQDIDGGRGVKVAQPGRRLTDEKDSDRRMLLTALETAEVSPNNQTPQSLARLCCRRDVLPGTVEVNQLWWSWSWSTGSVQPLYCGVGDIGVTVDL